MRRNTPLITLLTGAALGVVLLVASLLATPSSAPVSYSAADASSVMGNSSRQVSRKSLRAPWALVKGIVITLFRRCVQCTLP